MVFKQNLYRQFRRALCPIVRGVAFFTIIMLTAIAAHADLSPSIPVVVLVPGFFNSLGPGRLRGQGWSTYYSQTVVKTIKARGVPLVIADTLSSVGSVADNGARLAAFLETTATQFPNRPMVLLTHSAGGLYTMRALTLNPRLPVKTVVTVAAPYNGVELVDRVNDDVPGIGTLVSYLDLDSLKEFRAENMQRILSSFSIPDGIRWIAIAGTQPACFGLTCAQADHLSWVLSIAQSLMSEPSDGIVTRSSALGIGTALRTSTGHPLEIERWSDLNFALEHWEMVEDSHYFSLLGVVDTSTIRDLQVKLYNELLDRLTPELQGHF